MAHEYKVILRLLSCVGLSRGYHPSLSITSDMSARGFRNWERGVRTGLYPDTTVDVHCAARLNFMGAVVVW
jgi:hypothetical protein